MSDERPVHAARSSAEPDALARMREANQLREDLIASVSHEFRTPLTAIRGAAATLRARGEQIDPADRASLLDGIIEHGTRLSRLLEDMLLAASAAPGDPAAAGDVSAAVRRVPSRGLVVTAEADLVGHIDSGSLDHLLAALVSYAAEHRRTDRPARLSACRQDGEVLLRLRYVSDSALGDDAGLLLEAFGSRESAATGRPASLGLYVARRLAEAHGGGARASVAGDLVTVEIKLRAAGGRRTGRPASRTAAR